MTRRYLLRIAAGVFILATVLLSVQLFWPEKVKDQNWRYFLIGQVPVSGQRMSGQLNFARAGATTPDIENLAMLPGGLAYLPKNASPIFGRTAAKSDAVADAVLEPGSCLFIRRVQFDTVPAGGGSTGRTLLIVDQKSRLTNPSAKLGALLPPQCATATLEECQILVWAEARHKKCE